MPVVALRFLFIRSLLILCMALPAPVFAYGADGGGDSGSGYGGASGGLSKQLTNKVVKTLTRGARDCHKLDKIYRYDCYRIVYKRAADLLAGQAAYKEAYQALAGVEKTLGIAVARNADRAAPKLRRGVQTFQPVKQSSVPKMKATAIDALQQAETVLLRSAEDKGVHYASIAEAVNSNKVLLRSALLLLPGLGAILAILA